MRTIVVGGVVRSVCWCPNQALSVVAVAADRKLLLINPGVGDNLVVAKTDALLKELPDETSTSKLQSLCCNLKYIYFLILERQFNAYHMWKGLWNLFYKDIVKDFTLKCS